MPDNAPTNLDRLAAEHAQKIIALAKKVEDGKKVDSLDNVVTKALGVLQENGVYAAMLFLLTRTNKLEKELARIVRAEALGLLDELGFTADKPTNADDSAKVLAYITQTVTVRLQPMILAKETLEQMLVYARYGAKAWKAESGENGGPA